MSECRELRELNLRRNTPILKKKSNLVHNNFHRSGSSLIIIISHQQSTDSMNVIHNNNIIRIMIEDRANFDVRFQNQAPYSRP